MKKRFVFGGVVLVAALASIGFWRILDHDLDRRLSEPFSFATKGGPVSGTLWRPDGEPIAAVVLVHGDGPQDRTLQGGYAPLINDLLDRGIAVAAWDKPGVGASAGNWQHQTMAERTEETRAALAQLTARFKGLARGAVGFSQAGWVLPALGAEDTDFIVLIGAAVSWQEQGAYYTRVRLTAEGRSSAEIDETLAEQADADARVFGPDALDRDRPEGMSVDRWTFIRLNRTADAGEALARLDVPVLAIWGEDDLNVDAQANAAMYQDLLGARDARTRVIVWPEATHSLLRSDRYNWQLAEDWSWFAMARFLVEGRQVYAPGAVDAIGGWIAEVSVDRGR